MRPVWQRAASGERSLVRSPHSPHVEHATSFEMQCTSSMAALPPHRHTEHGRLLLPHPMPMGRNGRHRLLTSRRGIASRRQCRHLAAHAARRTVGDGLQSAVEGETARFEVLLTVASQDAAADGTGAVGHTSSLAHAAGMMRCRYEGADAGEAVLTGSSTDNSRLQYQFIPRLPGCIRILAEGPMPQTPRRWPSVARLPAL